MERGWLNLPYAAWAAICVAVAIVYAIFWPSDRVGADVGPLRLLLVRWGHSLAWALLAAMCLLKASARPNIAGWGNVVGLLAVPAYLAFLTATFVSR